MGWVDNFVRSKLYKEVSAKLYGIGASVVIVGALFKINHWDGGTTMLIIGMGIEAVIFFVSNVFFSGPMSFCLICDNVSICSSMLMSDVMIFNALS